MVSIWQDRFPPCANRLPAVQGSSLAPQSSSRLGVRGLERVGDAHAKSGSSQEREKPCGYNCRMWGEGERERVGHLRDGARTEREHSDLPRHASPWVGVCPRASGCRRHGAFKEHRACLDSDHAHIGGVPIKPRPRAGVSPKDHAPGLLAAAPGRRARRPLGWPRRWRPRLGASPAARTHAGSSAAMARGSRRGGRARGRE